MTKPPPIRSKSPPHTANAGLGNKPDVKMIVVTFPMFDPGQCGIVKQNSPHWHYTICANEFDEFLCQLARVGWIVPSDRALQPVTADRAKIDFDPAFFPQPTQQPQQPGGKLPGTR